MSHWWHGGYAKRMLWGGRFSCCIGFLSDDADWSSSCHSFVMPAGSSTGSDALVMLLVDGQICLWLRILESVKHAIPHLCTDECFFWPAVKPPVTKMLMLVFLRGFVILICEVCMLMTSIGLDTLSLKNLSFSYIYSCLLYTSPSPRDRHASRMPSSA